MANSQHTASLALTIPSFYTGESQGPARQFQIHVDADVPWFNLAAGMILLMDASLPPEDGDVVLVIAKSAPQYGQLLGQVSLYSSGEMGVTVAHGGGRKCAGSLADVDLLGVMAGAFQPRRGVNTYCDSSRNEGHLSEPMKEVAYS